ncbi:MAG TPA: hypothetical protein VK013_16630 [Myxococcaceae bacterium]|nr:hypothetical protein [Myxococcaceae bacterium]
MSSRSPQPRSWRREEHPLSALLQVLAIGLVMAAAVFFWVRYANGRSARATARVDAQTLLRSGNAGELRQATERLEALLQDAPQDGEARLLLARAHTDLFRLHGDEASGQAVDRVLEAGPLDDPQDAIAERMLIHLARGDAEGARRLLSSHGDAPRGQRLAFAEAELLRAEGALAEAGQRLERVLRGSREAPAMLLAAASLALDDGRVGLARRHLTRGKTLAPDHRGLQLMDALIQAREGSVPEGADALAAQVLGAKKAEASVREMSQAHALLAYRDLLEGKADAARKRAEEGLKVDPRGLAAAEVRARALLAQKDPAAAEAFLAAQKLRPTSRLVALDAAELLTGNGQLDVAERILEVYASTFRPITIEDREGRTTPALDADGRYWLARGKLLVAQDRGDEALAALDRSIGVRGLEQAEALWVKSRLLVDRDDPTRAREVLAQVTPEDGSGPLPGAYRTMGELLFAARDWQRGAMHYGFALGGLLNRGAPRDEAEALRQEVAERLRASQQPRLAQAWLEETRALVAPPTDT